MCMRLKAYTLGKVSRGQGAGMRAAGNPDRCDTLGVRGTIHCTAHEYPRTKPSNELGVQTRQFSNQTRMRLECLLRLFCTCDPGRGYACVLDVGDSRLRSRCVGQAVLGTPHRLSNSLKSVG